MNLHKVNLAEKLSLFSTHWSPKIVGELNGQQVKLVKLLGEFVWHSHADEDEMFFVIDGTLAMHLRDGVIKIYPGEFLIVPKGVEHKPVAEREVQLMLFEPAGTLNTGNQEGQLTSRNPEWI